jgi:hexokinase
LHLCFIDLLLTDLDSDTDPSLASALETFTERHPTPCYAPTAQDMRFVRELASYIARRSAAVIAASLVALWELKADAEIELLEALAAESAAEESPFVAEARTEVRIAEEETTMVAYTGSVVEFYPGYRDQLQEFIDALLAEEGASSTGDLKGRAKRKKGSIGLVEAKESSLRGAAVAHACLERRDLRGRGEGESCGL